MGRRSDQPGPSLSFPICLPYKRVSPPERVPPPTELHRADPPAQGGAPSPAVPWGDRPGSVSTPLTPPSSQAGLPRSLTGRGSKPWPLTMGLALLRLREGLGTATPHALKGGPRTGAPGGGGTPSATQWPRAGSAQTARLPRATVPLGLGSGGPFPDPTGYGSWAQATPLAWGRPDTLRSSGSDFPRRLPSARWGVGAPRRWGLALCVPAPQPRPWSRVEAAAPVLPASWENKRPRAPAGGAARSHSPQTDRNRVRLQGRRVAVTRWGGGVGVCG